MRKLICFILLGLTTQAQAQHDIPLLPGEILLSVDGVPTGTPTLACPDGSCTPQQSYQQIYPQVQQQVQQAPFNAIYRGYPAIIGYGTPAYEHALREAQIIASRGLNYHRYPDGGHPLGNAPGARYSGTGYTWDMNRPGHCWEDELPASRIIARARFRGTSGAWFWSAHYR